MRLMTNKHSRARTFNSYPVLRPWAIFTSILVLTGLFQTVDISTNASRAQAADTTFAVTQTLTSDYINTSSKVWPVGTRACVTGLTSGQSYSNVSATFNWTSSGAGIDLIGAPTQTVDAITSAQPCVDIYFQISITGTTPGTDVQSVTRKYTVTVNASGASPSSGAPTPATHSQTTSTSRQIWVAGVIDSASQKVGDIALAGSTGGAVTLTIGSNYTFTIPAETGTNSLASTVNAYFDPKIFQITSVTALYTARSGGSTTSTIGYLRNACGYVYIVGDVKYNKCDTNTDFTADVVMTYKVRVIGLGSQNTIPTSVTSLFNTDGLSQSGWKTYTKTTSTGITSINTVWPVNLTVNGGSATAYVSGTSNPVKVSGTSTSTGCSTYPCTVTSNYSDGSVLTLTASAGPNETFAGWGGACSGSALTCTITVDAIQNVTASFGTIFPLSVIFAGNGYGSVTSNPAAISCSNNSSGATSGTCSTTYSSSGQSVTLTAIAAPGQLFTGWAGGCTTSTVATDKLSGTCTFTITSSKTIEATFVAKPTLSVKIGSNLNGPYDVTSDLGGISCTGDGDPTPNATTGKCDATFSIGDSVVLTAATVVSPTRPIWSVSPAGAVASGCATAAATCTLTITTNTVVNVTYAGMPLAVSVDSTKTGTGSVASSDSTINCGDGFTACSYLYGTSSTSTTLTATAKTGSAFGTWAISSTGTGAITLGSNCSTSSGQCTITWVSSTTSVTAVASFNRTVTLTVTKSGAGSGTVTSASANINCGSTCSKSYSQSPFAQETLTATPAAGSYFIGWSGAGCSGTSTCTVEVNDNLTVIAQFGVAYTITVSSGPGGSISPGTSSTVPSGSTPTYTITPDAGYRVISATLNGTTNVLSQLVTSGSNKTYTFAAVTQNQTLAVTFSNIYTITVNSGSNGSISPGTSSSIVSGSTPTYTITPATGYHVETVTVDGNNVSVSGTGAEKTYTFSNVNSDMTLAATFAIDVFTISASSGGNGTISPSGDSGVSWGASKEYTFTPATGYKVASVVINGVSQSWSQNTYSFTNVQANKTIQVNFTPITYNVTVTITGGGTSNTASGTVNYGATPEYVFTPNSGYHIVAATLNGTDIMSSLVTVSGLTKKYSFSAIFSDQTIAVTFSNKYAIVVTAGTNGAISPSTSYTIEGGTTPSYVVTPNTGYHIESITVDGTAVNLNSDVTTSGKVKTYTFSSISADHSISATFAIDTFTIEATASSGGTVSSSGVTTVNYGSIKSYTFTAASGYRVESVKVDGEPQSPVPTSYTFTSITANHTVEVVFAAISYTITASDSSNVTSTTATIGGSLNPGGDSPQTVTICWGSVNDLTGCTSVSVKTQVTNNSASNSLSINLTLLNPESTYYFKIFAKDSSGIDHESLLKSFKMSNVATLDASSIAVNAATLNGTFDSGSVSYANSDVTSLKLCYSTVKTSTYVLGGTKTCSSIWSGTATLASYSTKTSAVTVLGLDADTTYHAQIQIVYSNSSTQNGEVKTFTTLPNPEATVLPAVSVSSSKATIRGTVNPKRNNLNKVTFCWTEGSSLTLAECTSNSGPKPQADMDINIASWNGSSNSNQFEKALSDLKPRTTYTYLIYTASSNFVAARVSVAPLQTASVRAARFASYSTNSSTISGPSPSVYSAAVSNDIAYSSTGQFTTAGVSTESATLIGSTSARLNGNLYTPTGGLAAGDVSSVNLCYSTDSAATGGVMNAADLSCGSNLWAGTTLSGGTTQTYSRNLTGLTAQQTYYFQIKTTFTDGSEVHGSILNFTTLSSVAAPSVEATAATSISKTSATINGLVNANNSAISSAKLCWGSSSAMVGCTVIDLDPTGWSTSANVSVNANLTTLSPGTLYYYTVFAKNASGETTSTTAEFRTKVGVTYHKDSASSTSSGTAPTDSAEYAVGDSIKVLGNTTNLSWAGAYFAGWALNDAGTGTLYGPAATTTFIAPSSNVNFYAKWTKYTVTFNTGDGGGTAPGDLSGVITLPGKGSMTAPAGKTFNGWDCGAEGASFTPTVNTTCTAVWVSSGTYSVTYSASDATGGIIPSDATNYAAGATITVLGNPGNLSRPGYAFAGWYLEPDSSTLYGPTLTNKTYLAPSNNLTFKAKWSAYVVSFDAGTGGGTAPTDQTGVFNLPTSTGMTAPTDTNFGGWSCAPEGSPAGTLAAGTAFTPSANTVCTAVWISNAATFTVFYSATMKTGGTLPANTVGSGNVKLAQNTGGLFRNGYQFAGWIIQGNSFSAGGTYNLTIDVTAEANWIAISSVGPNPTTYTIRFFYTPGVSGPNTLTYVVGDPGITLPILSRPGYEFLGWSDKPLTKSGSIFNFKPTKSQDMWTVWRNLPIASAFYFGGDSAVLKPSEKIRLRKLALKVMKNSQKPQVFIFGWVKATHNQRYDRKLSYARALNTAKYLQSLGVDAIIKNVPRGISPENNSKSRRTVVEIYFSGPNLPKKY